MNVYVFIIIRKKLKNNTKNYELCLIFYYVLEIIKQTCYNIINENKNDGFYASSNML